MAAVGLLLLLGGIGGGALLYGASVRRPAQAVDAFARAPIGCTTTLEFTETGTFYVYEELSGVADTPNGNCEPLADPLRSFGFELTGPRGTIATRADASLSYDTDDQSGTSVARVDIQVAGRYEIAVVGDDPAVVAAIGRDPDDGVEGLRRRALLVAVIGVVTGGVLLILAGRRSKRAAEFFAPEGPGWGPPMRAGALGPMPETRLARLPVNPHEPPEQVSIAPPLSEVNRMLATPRSPRPPWSPPSSEPDLSLAPPEPPEPPEPPVGE